MYQSIELHVTRHATHIRHDTQYLVFLTFSSRAMSEVLDDPVLEENGVAGNDGSQSHSQSQGPSVIADSTENGQVKCSQEDPSDSADPQAAQPCKDPVEGNTVQVKLEIPDYEPGGGGIGEEIDPAGGTAQGGNLIA